jgi:hypothetical protein
MTHYADEHCRLITDALLERLEEKYCGPPRTMSLHGTLVLRESTAPAKASARPTVAGVRRAKEVLSA